MSREIGSYKGFSPVPTSGETGTANGVWTIMDQFYFKETDEWPAAYVGPGPFTINQALRIRTANNSITLSKNNFSGSTPTTWTVSYWMKLGTTASWNTFGSLTGSYYVGHGSIVSGNQFTVWGLSTALGRTLRDYGAWYHLVHTFDNSNSRNYRVYVNGDLTLNTNISWPADPNFMVNGGTNYVPQVPAIGAFAGYLADFYAIDGTVLDPTTFGEFNSNGVWVPIEPTITNYGTNGFHLDFSDPTNIGKDVSGNGNDFTATGFETTDQTSSNYDYMLDSPTNNFATLNPIWANESPSSLPMITSDANLSESSATAAPTPGTISIDSPSYCEFKISPTPYYVGIWDINIADTTDFLGGSAYGNRSLGIYTDGSIYVSGGVVGTALPFSGNDIVGLAYDPTSRELFQWVNGVAANSGNAIYTLPAEVEKWTFVSNSNASKQSINFGQQPFKYTPPAGFEPLSTASIPTATIKNGREHFRAITDTGANILTSAQTAFPSGLWWIKDRVNANQHQLVDSVRGGNLALTTPTVGAETTYSAPTGDSVSWFWKYNSANPSQNGFDIVTYSGTGVTRTVNHSLGSVPEFMIVKNRDNAAPNSQFCVYHASVGATQTAYLNVSSAFFADSNMWANTEPTANQFTVGTNQAVNNNGQNIIAYLWTSVPGYSAFGSYTGNANADGPFVYLGFRPAFLMIKSTGTESWYIRDSSISTTNPAEAYFVANTTTNEVAGSGLGQDFLSNGFKIRTSNAGWNASAQTYIYAAFAENPFGGSNVSPANAR